MTQPPTPSADPRIDPQIRYFWEGWWGGGTIEPRRRLYDCEFVHVSAGAADCEIEGGKHRLGPGTAVIIPPGMPHQTYVPIGGEVVRHCIHFDWVGCDRLAAAPLWVRQEDPFDGRLVHAPPPAIAARLPLIVDLAQDRLIASACQLALCLLRKQDPLAGKQLAVVLHWMLGQQPQPTAAAASDAADPHRRLAPVLRHIDQHFAEPITHQELCRITGLSSSSLCKSFQTVLGMRPLAYLHQVRIRNSQRMLVEIDIPVSEVARMVGFADVNYFCRLFRRETGMTPGQCRLRGRQTRDSFDQSMDVPGLLKGRRRTRAAG